MSIHGFFNKIKRVGQAHNFLPLYILIIVASSLLSFFLGRLSLPEVPVNQVLSQSKETAPKNEIAEEKDKLVKKSSAVDISSGKQGRYVASKNGKLYYSASCKGANRIKPENRVWFDTESDAQKSGYTWATSCK